MLFPIQSMLFLLNCVTLVFAGQLPAEQQIFGDTTINAKSRNVTLKFDELETSLSSGIGFTPNNARAILYHDLYLHSFTLVNTPNAMHHIGSKDNPMLDIRDIFCATSPPNALFGSLSSLNPHQSYPRLSLHDLSVPYSAQKFHTNNTFDVLSISTSPTGFIPRDHYAFIYIKMLRLPRKSDDAPPFLFHGDPLIPQFSTGLSKLVMIFPPGYRQSYPTRLRDLFGYGFARGVDTLEFNAEIMKLDRKNRAWGPPKDMGFCLDDVILEITEQDAAGVNAASRSGGAEVFGGEEWMEGGGLPYIFFQEDALVGEAGFLKGKVSQLEDVKEVILRHSI